MSKNSKGKVDRKIVQATKYNDKQALTLTLIGIDHLAVYRQAGHEVIKIDYDQGASQYIVLPKALGLV